MLVEFRVKNFRSLRDEQVLSLVASKDKTLQETHTLCTNLKAVPRLLRSVVVYGANAGGKSNLIKALQFMRNVVRDSATSIQPGQSFSVRPFELDKHSAEQPTEFEVTFIEGEVRYQYGFAMTSHRIVSEHLLVYKAFKPQRWFERYFDGERNKDIYEFGPNLKGAKHVWEGATRPNSLFLSMAIQLNNESMRPVFDWFMTKLIIFNEQEQLGPHPAIQMLKHADGKRRICELLTAADISISDIDVITNKVPAHGVHIDIKTGTTEVRHGEVEADSLRFSHATNQGTATFDLMDESNGTRNLLFLTGPVLDILKNGLTLVIDELDTSLHTLLVRELVGLFHQPEINTSGAQIIFTTHDTSLLDAQGLFRRDQIWFVEKDKDQASTLIALAECGPRKNEALEKGYLIGRYGGVPFLRDSLGLKE